MNGGLGQVINDIFQLLGIELPPWGGIALALCIGAIIFPYYLQGQKMMKARKMLKQSTFENYEQRRRMEIEAMQLVRSSPHFTLSLAQQSFELGRFSFAKELLETLPPDNRTIQRESQRLQKQMLPKEDETLDFALIAVERLLEEELYDAAWQRCLRIEEKWKNNPQVSAKKLFIQEKRSHL